MHFVAHAVVAEGKHVLTMDEVLRVEVILPNEQIGQRYCEIVHNLLLERPCAVLILAASK